MRPLLAAIALGSIAAPVAASAQDAAGAPDAIAERFLQSLKGGKVEAALKDIAGDSKLLSARLAADPTLATQIDAAIKHYGPVLSWERIESDTLGTTARRDIYLVRHRDMATRWRFFFVRTGTGWSAGSFTFEDQLPTWFKSSD